MFCVRQVSFSLSKDSQLDTLTFKAQDLKKEFQQASSTAVRKVECAVLLKIERGNLCWSDFFVLLEHHSLRVKPRLRIAQHTASTSFPTVFRFF